MKITLADTAGFCFGVDRAVKTTEACLARGERVCTLGPLIHNPGFIRSLEARGVSVAETPAEAPEGGTLIVRTHGVTKSVSEELGRRGLSVVDATCPFVKKIHAIVARQSAAGDVILIAGDETHPEVVGIRSYAETPSFVFGSAEELAAIRENPAFTPETVFTMVSQTTFDEKEFKKCKKIAKSLYTNLKIFDTICNATALRQKEAASLAAGNDMMIVIGGRNSSNTQKLFAICSQLTRTYLIEDAAELSAINFKNVSTIGVTAGASTPEGKIKEVLEIMSEINENISPVVEAEGQAEAIAEPEEMSFEQALEENLSRMSNDKQVVGVVMRVLPNEIQVDIGRKQTGYIPLEEYSADPTADPTQELHVGDQLDLIIMKTNDVEGTIMLSKRLCDERKYWNTIVEAYKEKTILEGTVVEVISKGVIIFVNGVRVFVPASQSDVPRGGRLEELLNKTVQFVIIDIDRHKAVGSIRDARKVLSRASRDQFWAQVEEGQIYHGVVRSLTDFGAFVEVAPWVDGLVHITELSWNRVKHPSEIVNVGDEIDVTVLHADKEKKKLSLTYRKPEDSPWEVFKRDYPVGTVTTVRIVRMTTFGAFAEILPKIEGLIHVSQISYNRVEKPQDVLSINDKVEVKITDIDPERKRISLSMKALLPPPERKPSSRGDRRSERYDDEPAVMSIEDMIAQAKAKESEPAPEAVEAPAAVEEAPAAVEEVPAAEAVEAPAEAAEAPAAE